MHEVLHFIGICPDSLSHLDLIDLITANHIQLTNLLQFLFKK